MKCVTTKEIQCTLSRASMLLWSYTHRSGKRMMPREILYSNHKGYVWHRSVFHGGGIASIDEYEHVSQRNSGESIQVFISVGNKAGHLINTEELVEQFDPWYNFNNSPACRYNIIQPNELYFSRLVELWREEKGIVSSISEMVSCPSYLAIIGMGEKALPLILSQIERERDDPDYWFAALEAITGYDPVLEEDYGDTVRMAQAWLSWAEQNYVR